MSFLAAYPVAGEDFLPYAFDCIEPCGFQGDFAVRSAGLLFHVQQALQFIGENHVYEFVKLAHCVGPHVWLLAYRLPVERIDRTGTHGLLPLWIKCL